VSEKVLKMEKNNPTERRVVGIKSNGWIDVHGIMIWLLPIKMLQK